MRRVSALGWFALLLVSPFPAFAGNDTALRLANVDGATTCYVRVPNSAAFSLQAFTLEAWVQRVGAGFGVTTDGVGGEIVGKPAEGTVGSHLGSWYLLWNNSGQIVFDMAHASGVSGVAVASPVSATPLARHHVAATFDGATITLYVDGVPSGSAAWTLGTVYYGANDVLIGAANFGAGYFRRFDGYVDDVRIWDHARTPGEIAGYRNCTLNGNEPGLVAYWSFDGSNLTDLTGHGHNGAATTTVGALTYAPLAPLGTCIAGVDDAAAPGARALALSVYPQPARGNVTVSFDLPRPGPATVEVLDLAGRRLAVWEAQEFAAGPHQLTRSLSALGAGTAGNAVLFVRVRAAGETAVRMLVTRR